MKPLHLRITAFGPYIDEQVVDFSKLIDRGFFLIHGATGSGKTSILDAICFTLYGLSSGDRNLYRSHHAASDQKTSVVFEFAIGNQKYQASRWITPSGNTQKRLKVFKDGSFVDYGQSREFTDRIKSLLGFNADQFRQVVMLPQNQFSKFLLAKTQDKEEILKTLFSTERYQKITNRLREKAAEIEQKYAVLTTSRQLILDRHYVNSVDDLNQLLQNAVEERNRLDNEKKEIDQSLKRANHDFIQAEALERDYQSLDIVVSRHESCLKDKPNRDADASLLEDASQAAEMEPAYERITEAKSEIDRQVKAIHEADEKLLLVSSQLQTAQNQMAHFEETSESRENRKLKIHELETLLPAWQLYEDETVQYKNLHQSIEAIRQTIQNAETKKQKLNTELQLVSNQLQELSMAKESVIRLEAQHEKWQQILHDAGLKKEATTNQNLLKKSIADIANKKANVESQLAALTDQISEALANESKEQAALLASHLIDGTPCLVCGSTHHPNPAVSKASADQTSLEDLRANQSKLQSEWNRWLTEERVAQEKEAALANQISELDRRLGNWSNAADDSVTDAQAELKIKTETERLHQSLADAKKAAEKESQLKEQDVLLQKEKAECQEQSDELHNRLIGLTEQFSAIKARLEERKSNFDGFASVSDLEANLTMLKEQSEKDNRQISQLQKEIETLLLQQAKLQSTMALFENRKQEEQNHLKNYQEKFASLLKASKFKTESDFMNARLSRADRIALTAGIEKYDRESHQIQARLKELQSIVHNKPRPDLESMSTGLATLQAQAAAVFESRGVVSEKCHSLEHSLQDLQRIEADQAPLRSQKDQWKRLADTASGTSGRRIALQRYVLGYRLEEVAAAASVRLLAMTDDRYSLQLEQKAADLRLAAGLDLVVYDHRTGKNRPVSSLSGGEGFLASLALALALSSVVQSRSGGIRLDTIFIDEGFGSLDPEALDLAMATLKQLQAGGRLVGVISHVEEIKHQTQARIEVIAGPLGSRLQLHV